MPPLEPVPIFHIGRCGSTLLEKMLEQHPKVFPGGEVLDPVHSLWKKQHPELNAQEYIPVRMAEIAERHPEREVYPFEIKFVPGLHLDHFNGDMAALAAYVREIGATKAILLRRRNTLKRIVSTLMAIARGQYFAKPGTEIPPVQITFVPDKVFLGNEYEIVELLDFVEDAYAGMADALRAEGLDTCEIVYEDDLLHDPQIGYGKCLSFMGLDPAPARVNLARTQTQPLSEIIRNYAGLQARLRDTRHAWMLED